MLNRERFAVVGDCPECDGQMVETSSMELDDARHVQLHCEDCGQTGELEHHFEDGPITNASCTGVSNPELETVRWVRCLNCDGSGEVIGCIDDICHGKGRCIHDGNDACPDCFGSGRQPRVVETDGGLSDGSKDVLITATADQLEHKRPENLLPSEEVYWSVAGKPRQTEPGRTVWFAHNGRIHARGKITKLELGYLWFDAAHKTDAPCLDDATSRGFRYIEPLRPRLADELQSAESRVTTDGGEVTVFLSAAARTSPETYHCDRECRYLQKSTSVVERSLASLRGQFDPCSVCAGEDAMTDGGEWAVTRPADTAEYVPLDMANNITDERVRERIAWVDGAGRAYADALDTETVATDGGEVGFVDVSDRDPLDERYQVAGKLRVLADRVEQHGLGPTDADIRVRGDTVSVFATFELEDAPELVTDGGEFESEGRLVCDRCGAVSPEGETPSPGQCAEGSSRDPGHRWMDRTVRTDGGPVPEPIAAEEVDDGDCAYGGCDADADYRVELDNGVTYLLCQPCSNQNRIYCRENDLLDNEVSADD